MEQENFKNNENLIFHIERYYSVSYNNGKLFIIQYEKKKKNIELKILFCEMILFHIII